MKHFTVRMREMVAIAFLCPDFTFCAELNNGMKDVLSCVHSVSRFNHLKRLETKDHGTFLLRPT